MITIEYTVVVISIVDNEIIVTEETKQEIIN